LPEILRQAGFTTAAYTSNANIGREVGFARGWQAFREQEGASQQAARVTDLALEMADQLRPPFFFYVHYIDPHDPYTPKEAWGRSGLPRSEYVQPRDMLQGKYKIDGPEMDTMRAQYDGEVHEMDAEIERLVRGFEERSLLEDTLLVVTADHGEEFGDHGSVAHGHHLHEEVVRVPFLLQMPALRPYRSDAPFHHVDFVPTILEALGVAFPSGLDGVSRWQKIASDDLAPQSPQLFHLDVDRFGELAVLASPYKLIYRPAQRESLLYDIAADPREESPLPPRGQQHDLLSRLARRHNVLSTRASRRATGELSEGLRDRLNALGYAVPDPDEEKVEVRVMPPRIELGR
jgi:arylsulfatase A-like enzyme